MLVNKMELDNLDSYYEEEIETILKEEEIRRKKKRRKKKVSSKISAILFAIFGLLLCIYILNGYTNITRLRLQIVKLEDKKYELEKEREDLMAQLEYMKNTAKIEENARVKLGMDYPNEEQLVYLTVEEFDTSNQQEENLTLYTQVKNAINLVMDFFRGA